MATVKVTDESFERDVLQAAKPVLVDFWAEWCGPCKQIAPSLDQISEELSSAVTVAKVNIEESPMTPGRYGVRGIPTPHGVPGRPDGRHEGRRHAQAEDPGVARRGRRAGPDRLTTPV